MPQPPSDSNPMPLNVVADYLRQALPSCTIEDIGKAGVDLLLLRTAHSAIGIAASTEELENSYEVSYRQYKDYFLKNETSQFIDPAFVLLLPRDAPGDIERFCSVVETDVYFCRKFVVPLKETVEKSLTPLPFLPLAPIGAASLRPASAQTFIQRCGVAPMLAKSLVTPHDRGPEKTVDDAVRGVFGDLSLESGQGASAPISTDRSTGEVVVDSITITGIRAYNRPQTFSLGTAVTILYGPNGFGKTSFFDAIDFAITGGLGRLSSLSESQLDKVLPHLDAKPRDGSVTLSFRRNEKPGSLTRTVRDRKWALLDGERADRKTVLSSLTKGANQSADRVENFISLFRATHLFNQEQQEIAKDFRSNCQLNEAVVSRLLAFEDYNNAVHKLQRISKCIEERMGRLNEDIDAKNDDISRARAEIERTEKSLRSVASPQTLDEEFATLSSVLSASQMGLALPSSDINGLRALRGAIDIQIAQATARIKRLNALVAEIAALPKLVQELAAVSAQLTDLRSVSVTVLGERSQAEAALAQVDQNVSSYRAEIAGMTTQLNQLSWILEVEPRRAHAIAEVARLQAVRAALVKDVAAMQEREASLRETIEKAEDDLKAANDQVAELREHEGAVRSLVDIAAEWLTSRERFATSESQLMLLRAAKEKAASEVGDVLDVMRALEGEIADISEIIRRSDVHRSELQELLALLEGHAADQDCPLCGQEYRSHDELVTRIQAKSAQDPLHEVRSTLASKRSVQLETQSRYDAVRGVLRTSETQLAEAERVNQALRQRMQDMLTMSGEAGFALDVPDFAPDAVTKAAEEARAELVARMEHVKQQKQVADQAKATLASANSAIKRRQDEIVRTDALLERQRTELGRLQADSRYSEALISATAQEREQRKASLDQALTSASARLSAAEAEQAALKKTITELSRRLTGNTTQMQQVSRRDAELRSAQSAAIQRVTGAGLPADTSNEDLLSAVSIATKALSDLEILKEKAVSLEVGLDAAASAAILEQYRTTISANDNQVKALRQQQRKLRDAERYFGELHKLVSTQQNEAISNFTSEYGPRTSVIQRRLRSVYSFDDVEIRADDAKITVCVKRNGEEFRPIDFFSQSQLQTLMLGLFLTACSAQTWSSFSTVFLDDPVTHFDDLNTYALLDLISGMLESADGARQFIISTCDDRLLELARQKFRGIGDRAKFYQFTAIGTDGPVVSELN
jgi:DNA repair protein SbcC/Rad50